MADSMLLFYESPMPTRPVLRKRQNCPSMQFDQSGVECLHSSVATASIGTTDTITAMEPGIFVILVVSVPNTDQLPSDAARRLHVAQSATQRHCIHTRQPLCLDVVFTLGLHLGQSSAARPLPRLPASRSLIRLASRSPNAVGERPVASASLALRRRYRANFWRNAASQASGTPRAACSAASFPPSLGEIGLPLYRLRRIAAERLPGHAP